MSDLHAEVAAVVESDIRAEFGDGPLHNDPITIARIKEILVRTAESFGVKDGYAADIKPVPIGESRSPATQQSDRHSEILMIARKALEGRG